MVSARHDVYIFRDNGELLVWPGTLAVSACTWTLRFRNLAPEAATIDFKRMPVSRDGMTLPPGGGGSIDIDWSRAESGVYTYAVTAGGDLARGNSEPRIIFD